MLSTYTSTKADLVGINYAMGQILWARHFHAGQDLYAPTRTINQDNKSTILMSENWKLSRAVNQLFL